MRRYLWAPVALFLVLRVGAIVLAGPSAASTRLAPIPRGGHWVATWTASPQPATPGNLSLAGFRNATVREIVLTSAGGVRVRVRISNAFGTAPLRVGGATVAIAGGGANTRRGSTTTLYFDRRPSVLIPPGGEAVSDQAPLTVPSATHLAVSIFLPGATGPATQHLDAEQVNYVSKGSRLGGSGRAFRIRTRSWYFLDGVDVLTPARVRGAVVALGDSITDGVGSPLNRDGRWPNDLAARLNARPGATLAVLNAGIGGNRVLNTAPCCGTSAIARFERDVRAQPGARDVILLEGVNDIGMSNSRSPTTVPHVEVSALQIVEGYERMIVLAHTAGLHVFGATLTPFAGARYWTPRGEAKREAVNHWIRTSGAFDGVIDFASAVADPKAPNWLKPAYDSGDHLHPNAAGYRAMAAAINLAALLRG